MSGAIWHPQEQPVGYMGPMKEILHPTTRRKHGEALACVARSKETNFKRYCAYCGMVRRVGTGGREAGFPADYLYRHCIYLASAQCTKRLGVRGVLYEFRGMIERPWLHRTESVRATMREILAELGYALDVGVINAFELENAYQHVKHLLQYGLSQDPPGQQYGLAFVSPDFNGEASR